MALAGGIGPMSASVVTTHLTCHDVGCLEPLGHRVTLAAGTTVAWEPVRAFWGISGDLWSGGLL